MNRLGMWRVAEQCCQKYSPSQARTFTLKPKPVFILARRGNTSAIQRFKAVSPHHYVMLIFPCITFYLGVWQIKRRKWKLGLIDELKRKHKLAAVPLPADLSAITADREYERFIAEGQFDHSRETFIGPRVLLDPTGAGGGLISSGGTTGVHVVTPLKLSGRDEDILVNRGWISRQASREDNFDRPTGTQRVEGVYRNPEVGSAGAAYDVRTKMWSKRNVSVLAEALGTRRVFLDMCDSPNHKLTDHSPLPGQTNIYLRNEHLSYIFTWFSLTALMLIIWSNRHLRTNHDSSKLLDLVRTGRGGQSVVLATKKKAKPH